MNTKLLGRWGEEQAALFLKNKGYELLGVGFSTRFGEIDIIAQKDGYVAFVEVKLRKNDAFAPARDAVTYAKREKIKTTAQIWIEERNCDLPCRFDVVEVYAPVGARTKSPYINHIEDAF